MHGEAARLDEIERAVFGALLDQHLPARHAEGLVGLSACLGGEIPRSLEIEDWDSARRIAKEYEKIYENPSEYGVWGHGIEDLVFEAVVTQGDENVYLSVGS